jgi:DNA-binding NarL/FixJ family response regulator
MRVAVEIAFVFGNRRKRVARVPIDFTVKLDEYEPLSGLTVREQSVMQAMVKGKGNKEIASQLNISTRTVKFHVSTIFKKFRVTNRAELFYAWRMQKLEPLVLTEAVQEAKEHFVETR